MGIIHYLVRKIHAQFRTRDISITRKVSITSKTYQKAAFKHAFVRHVFIFPARCNILSYMKSALLSDIVRHSPDKVKQGTGKTGVE
ncbi:MAG: hypothetical protein JRJ62_16095 [Deltaproteobacteria bacterium]|nr:hypothetical protein [Deltaproteobacteria bacterium]